MGRHGHEKRRSVRSRGSDALYWRALGTRGLMMGWLLEKSKDGLAFAWRGGRAPARGMLVEVRIGEGGERRRGVVRRAAAVHEDLHVVGVELQHAPDNTARIAHAEAPIVVVPPVGRLRPPAPERGLARSVSGRHA